MDLYSYTTKQPMVVSFQLLNDRAGARSIIQRESLHSHAICIRDFDVRLVMPQVPDLIEAVSMLFPRNGWRCCQISPQLNPVHTTLILYIYTYVLAILATIVPPYRLVIQDDLPDSKSPFARNIAGKSGNDVITEKDGILNVTCICPVRTRSRTSCICGVPGTWTIG
jgi:hypothetical protein